MLLYVAGPKQMGPTGPRPHVCHLGGVGDHCSGIASHTPCTVRRLLPDVAVDMDRVVVLCWARCAPPPTLTMLSENYGIAKVSKG